MHTWCRSLPNLELKTLWLTLSIVAVGCALSSLERLALHKEFKTGIFCWTVRRTSARFRASPVARAVSDRLFAYPTILLLLGTRVAAALLVPLSFGNPALLTIGAFGVAITSMLLTARGFSGFNGADQLAKIIYGASALCLAVGSAFALRCGLAFIAMQLTAHYVAGGLLRAREPSWWDGSALLLVLRQHTYGNERLWRVGRSNLWLVRLCSRSVLVFECLFPIGLLLPPPGLAAWLAFGVAFHCSVALIMGLNQFLWVFVGAYPAFMWASCFLRAMLG